MTRRGDRDAVYLSWGHLLPTDGPVRGEDIERYQFHTPIITHHPR